MIFIELPSILKVELETIYHDSTSNLFCYNVFVKDRYGKRVLELRTENYSKLK